MSCDTIRPLGKKIQRNKTRGLLLHLLGGKEKKSRVHLILENHFKGEEQHKDKLQLLHHN